jgi:hypothetical protein
MGTIMQRLAVRCYSTRFASTPLWKLLPTVSNADVGRPSLVAIKQTVAVLNLKDQLKRAKAELLQLEEGAKQIRDPILRSRVNSTAALHIARSYEHLGIIQHHLELWELSSREDFSVIERHLECLCHAIDKARVDDHLADISRHVELLQSNSHDNLQTIETYLRELQSGIDNCRAYLTPSNWE